MRVLEAPRVDASRVERLLARCRASVNASPSTLGSRYKPERTVLFAAAFAAKTEGSVPLRWARAVAEVLERVAIAILPDELIVGEPGVAPVDPEALAQAQAYLAAHRVEHIRHLETFPIEPLYAETGLSSTWHAREGHNALAFGEILARGIGGMQQQAADGLARALGAQRGDADAGGPTLSTPSRADGAGEPVETPASADEDTFRRVAFYQAALVALDGLSAFVRRHAALARDMAADSPGRAAELAQIASTCDHLSAGPARSFRDALQLTWFLHLGTKLEDGGVGHSFGRFDQYLYPYYRADLEAGRATRGELLDLLTLFWIKVNSEDADTAHLMVGGVDAHGFDASNDLTFACLEAQRRVGLTQPELSVRVHPGTPERLWREAASTIRLGSGHPALYGDATHVTGLARLGVPLEVARDYTKVGCVETFFAGRSTPWVGLYVNGAKCLELVLTGGRCLLTGREVGVPGPATADIASFEELIAAIEIRIRDVTQLALRGKTLYDRNLPTFQAAPLQSALTPCCLARGRDLYDGGAEYTVTGPYLVGLATTVDSLSAIRRLVFEEGALTLPELVEALRTNFAGGEALRLRLLNQMPKYGNDDSATDRLAHRLASSFHRATAEIPGAPSYLRMPIIAASTTAHVKMGAATGASADGRRLGEPLSEGCSPAQGRSRQGVTAALRSVTSIDHTLVAGGEAVNLTLAPGSLKGEDGLDSLIGLLRAYFDTGGAQVQISVVSRATLEAARRDPAAYRHLLVRVTGFSAYFTALEPDLQQEIIDRTEHAL